MNRKKIWIVVAMISVVLGIVLGVGIYGIGPGRWKKVTILTATEGGTYYPLGQCLAQILEELPGQRIKDAKAELTGGSIANIERLLDKKDNVVAFAMASDLVRVPGLDKEKLRILARLYDDVMQIVVHRDTNIKTTNDLKKFFKENKNRKIFIGPERSGTRMITTQILKSVGLSEENYTPDNATSFDEAAKRLEAGELDAAFFVAGTPTEAVRDALESGKCELLSLDPNTLASLTERDRELGLKEWNIPAHLYENQPYDVNTLASDVLLICRKDLDKDLAAVIVKGLFYDTERLELAHSKALEIKLTDALDIDDLPISRHPGVKTFLDETLLIATGAMNGYYYRLGKNIQNQLEAWGIPAVTIHTDGSFENAKLLMDWHAIAVMQYDAALAAQCGNLKSIYKMDLEDMDISHVKGIHRIATLHEEKVHVIIRKDALNRIERNLGNPNSQIGTIKRLDELRDALEETNDKVEVCVGPEDSGTQAIARAVIKLHHLEGYTTPLQFSVSAMVERLHAGTLDAGFFVSHVPMAALLSVVENAEVFRLLSFGLEERGQIKSNVFKMSSIEPGTYECQDEVINTVATRAVLVTTKDLPKRFPVRDITEAIFEGEAYLGIEGLTKKTMAERLPSLPLHPGANQHYKTEEVLGLSPPPMHWLRQTWTVLTCLTMLVTVMFIPGYTGLIIVRRNRTANEIGRRILAIPLGASVQHSVQRLLNIRDEIQERVRRRWWRWGELDKHRWRYLRDLLHDRIGEAKENLTRAFVIEIRAVMSNTELTDARRQKQCLSIENRILEFFGKGELDPSQQKILREVLRECGQQDAKTRESKGGKK